MTVRDAVYWAIYDAYGFQSAAMWEMWRAWRRSELTMAQVARRIRRKQKTLWKWFAVGQTVDLENYSDLARAMDCRADFKFLPARWRAS